jgi:hypothetical protein
VSARVVKTFTYLWMDSLQICWAHTNNGHMRVINCSLTYGRFLFKSAVNILQITTSSKGYVFFMFIYRAHACERACASARVVKYSIIFGRILFKLDGHILQMTTSYMGYIRVQAPRAHACASGRACASKRMTTYPQSLHELFNVCVNACPNSAHQYTSRICQACDGQ